MAEFRSCSEEKTMVPKASGGDVIAREERARGESKGWRLVEVRGGTGIQLAFYRAEGRSRCGRGGGVKHRRWPSMAVEPRGEAVL
jgi:hypothetical protein